MKTQEELNALKEEIKVLNKKFAELTDEELAQVTGGVIPALEEIVKAMRLKSDNTHLGFVMYDSNGGHQQR